MNKHNKTLKMFIEFEKNQLLYEEALAIITQYSIDSSRIDTFIKRSLDKEEIADIIKHIKDQLLESQYEQISISILNTIILNSFNLYRTLGKVKEINIYFDPQLFNPTIKFTDDELIEKIEIEFMDTIDIFCQSFTKQFKDTPYNELLDQITNSKIEDNLPKLRAFVKTIGIINLVYPYWAKFADLMLSIKDNDNELNQSILDNSYIAIIYKISMYSIKNDLPLQLTNEIISRLTVEKDAHLDLFTNQMKFTKLKSDNHYMSFLYKCTISPFAGNPMLMIFTEFVEANISGYIQWLESTKNPNRIDEIIKDLAILAKYNTKKENEDSIQQLRLEKQLLSIPKAQLKLLPFKELANKLGISTKQITNYLLATQSINKKMITKNFNALVTKTKDINIVIKSK